MIKFFGLLSKKKKVKLQSIVDIYCGALDEVISNGFIEIKDFINNYNKMITILTNYGNIDKNYYHINYEKYKPYEKNKELFLP